MHRSRNWATNSHMKAHAGNTGFASNGVTCKLGALCFYSTLVVADSFVLRYPYERQALKTFNSILTQ